jgi:hypothetical protein
MVSRVIALSDGSVAPSSAIRSPSGVVSSPTGSSSEVVIRAAARSERAVVAFSWVRSAICTSDARRGPIRSSSPPRAAPRQVAGWPWRGFGSRWSRPARRRASAGSTTPRPSELDLAAVIEALDRLHQSNCSLLNEVVERNASAAVRPRKRVHQPQVALDHLFLGVEIALLDPRGERDLLASGQDSTARRLTLVSGCSSVTLMAAVPGPAGGEPRSTSRR